MTKEKRFLIINPFGIGDVLFTTPALRAIKKAHPKSYIVYWCNERVSPVLKNNPYIDKIIALSRGDLKKIASRSWIDGIKANIGLFKSIKAQKCDICLDFSLDHRYSLISKFCSIKKRIGFDYKNRGRLLTDKIKLGGYEEKHVIEYYLELLKPLNILPAGTEMELHINAESLIMGKEALLNLGIGASDLKIGVAPGGGGSWGKDAQLKHWPAENFGRLADMLINEKAKIIILADSSELLLSQRMIKAMHNKPVDLSGKTSLDQLAEIISNLDVLVCNDGGPLHMAKALKVKTVSVFGPVDERVYGPYPLSVNDHVVKCDISCRPCYRNFRMKGCVEYRRCITDIGVEQVFSQVHNLL